MELIQLPYLIWKTFCFHITIKVQFLSLQNILSFNSHRGHSHATAKTKTSRRGDLPFRYFTAIPKTSGWLKIYSSDSLEILSDSKHHAHLEEFWCPSPHSPVMKPRLTFEENSQHVLNELFTQERFLDELCLTSTGFGPGHYVPKKLSLLVPTYREPAFGREDHVTTWWHSHMWATPRQAFISNLH